MIIGFSSLLLVTIAIFALIAYQTSLDSLLSHESGLLERLVREEVEHHYKAIPSHVDVHDPAVWTGLMASQEENDFIDLIGRDGKIFAASIPLEQLQSGEFSLLPWEELLTSSRRSGSIAIGDEFYIWAKADVADTDLTLLNLHYKIDKFSVILSKMNKRLIASAVVLMWFSLWLIMIFSTIIHRRLQSQNEELEYRSSHDELTNLSNSFALRANLKKAIYNARAQKKLVAMLVIDLDRFKEINNTLGHTDGDHVLIEVSRRLVNSLRSSDTIARFGADEFGVVISVESIEHCNLVVEKIIAALSQPYNLDDHEFGVESSIGIAFYPDHGEDVSTLIRHAEIAMYQAKERCYGYSYYDTSQDSHSHHRLTLINSLRNAIDNGELLLHFQPQIDPSNPDKASAEALIRWQHPTIGMIPPNDFIPLAEQSGIIHPLTQWVLEEAIKFSSESYHRGFPLNVAVNLSARNIQNSDLPDMVYELLRRYKLDPAYLTLEITETAIVLDPQRALEILSLLHEMGVTLSIDDFGTGYTSLSYLNILPVHEIKIDQSFVRNMDVNRSNATIVRSIIELAHNMSYRVIGEGVENREIVEQLIQLGCDIVQGYYIARPMPGEAFITWLESPGSWEIPAMANVTSVGQ